MTELLTPTQDDSVAGRSFRLLFGAYVIVAFVVFGTLAIVAATLIPGLARRRTAVHRIAALFFAAAGLPLTVRGLERLPPGACVLVANHASYLDGVVLKAALPARFGFVIKKEIVKVPLAATLLRQIGSEFVDRFNRQAGAMDARRLMRAASSGQALVFFPEGTFTPTPGLSRFHSGAFATAARARVPIVPAVIRGTRTVLPCNRLLVQRHAIEVEILQPIEFKPEQGAPNVEAVRDHARNQILERLNEPDLTARPP